MAREVAAAPGAPAPPPPPPGARPGRARASQPPEPLADAAARTARLGEASPGEIDHSRRLGSAGGCGEVGRLAQRREPLLRRRREGTDDLEHLHERRASALPAVDALEHPRGFDALLAVRRELLQGA